MKNFVNVFLLPLWSLQQVSIGPLNQASWGSIARCLFAKQSLYYDSFLENEATLIFEIFQYLS